MAAEDSKLTRRTLLAGLATGAAAAPLMGGNAHAASRTIKLGMVAPKTGQLAVQYEGVPFILDRVRQHLDGKIRRPEAVYPYDLFVADSQSDSNRAAQVTQDLILNKRVDVMMAFGAPDTVNPVADQCEANGVPCVCTMDPLESFYYGRGAPKQGFQWTYDFFLSANQIILNDIAEFGQIPTNKVVGALWPNDADGLAFAKVFPPALKKAGCKLIDPGRFDMPSNYTAQIAAFKEAGAEIVVGVLPPPEFVTFWNAAAQQQYRPKIVDVEKASSLPQPLIPLGRRAYNLSTAMWWTPAAPFVSGLTGVTAKELAAEYEKATGQQWTMMVGFPHALMEVAVYALSHAKNIAPEAIRDSLSAMDYKSIVGPINFQKGPYPNTCMTPVVNGQYRKGAKYPLDLLVVENTYGRDIRLEAKPMAIIYD